MMAAEWPSLVIQCDLATHLGTHYAALLVKDGYQPQSVLDALPQTGDNILAVAVVPGAAQPPSPVLAFSGYQWRLRDAPSSRGGLNVYSPSNFSIDAKGAMHVRISKTKSKKEEWSCAEASLTRNLGYGTYEFVVRGLEALELPAVFDMFTFDYAGGGQHNRTQSLHRRIAQKSKCPLCRIPAECPNSYVSNNHVSNIH
jgi:hypothetical protein